MMECKMGKKWHWCYVLQILLWNLLQKIELKNTLAFSKDGIKTSNTFSKKHNELSKSSTPTFLTNVRRLGKIPKLYRFFIWERTLEEPEPLTHWNNSYLWKVSFNLILVWELPCFEWAFWKFKHRIKPGVDCFDQ